MTWKEYRGTGCAEMILGKVRPRWNSVKDVKNDKGFYRYVGQNTNVNVLPLINKKEKRSTADLEKVKVFSKFFASLFTGSQASCTSHVPEPVSGG